MIRREGSRGTPREACSKQMRKGTGDTLSHRRIPHAFPTRFARSAQKTSGGEGRGTLLHRGPPHQDPREAWQKEYVA